MDAHQLAVAALSQLPHPSSAHRPTEELAHADSHTNINTIYDGYIANHESSQSKRRTGGSGLIMEDSQESAVQPMSSNNSQSTDSASTPPTSSSDGFSSQSTNQDNQLSQLSQLSQLAAAQEPLISSETARPNIATAGQKRTADGHVKAPSPPSPYGPRRGHSRNTSTVSNVSSVASSRIGELSSELRTRLSYAMVKVNHGWQSNSIDEVESLASQTGSPTSSTSTLHGRRFPITSPRTAMIASRSQMSSQANPVTHAPAGDFDLYSRSEPTSRTYESFWRDHSTPIPLNSQPATKASLAPSAEIRPTSTSRRSHTPKFSKPPTIPGQGSNSSTSSIPHTPNRVTLNNDPKPLQSSQKTLQEQDAIETLLFMSSPGNSGNMGHQFPRPSQASPQNSPLRTEFHPQDRARGAQGRRVVFQQDITRGPLRTTALSQPSYAQRSKATGKTKEDAIDRLLDEMGDSSSDEAEVVLNYSSPRRVAAGRV